MNQSDDLFEAYGVKDKSIQELIEEFSVALMLKMCSPPKKIVLDKHTYGRFIMEIGRKIVRNEEATAIPAEVALQARKIIKEFNTSAGSIEIVCED